jgi:hypothetical protein
MNALALRQDLANELADQKRRPFTIRDETPEEFEARKAKFVEENRAAFEAYNRFVEKYGLLSDAYRNFARED